MTSKEEYKKQAIKFLIEKQRKLVKNFQTDIFSLERTGEYKKYKTDENYFKALALSNGIDEILEDLKILKTIEYIINDYHNNAIDINTCISAIDDLFKEMLDNEKNRNL